jgi:hypothetical protein
MESASKPASIELPLTDAPAPGSIHLLARVERQEMHFGWNTPEFGHIELHTTIEHDRVGAVVAVPDAGLRDSLQSDLDSLTRALAEHSLELGQFQASDSGANPESRRNNDSSTIGTVTGRQLRETVIGIPLLPQHELTHIGLLDLRA